MWLRRRNLVIWGSCVGQDGRHGAPHCERPARNRRIRRWIRIGALLTVIAVRPRWRPLLAATAFMVIGAVGRNAAVGIAVVPGLLFLWCALLTPADSDADRERRSQLKRELAAYSTAAQRCDLEAALEPYPDGLTREIRDILASQDTPPRNSGIPGAGWR